MDRLTPFFERFPARMDAFFSGSLSNRYDAAEDGARGEIHCVRSGRLDVLADGRLLARVDEPAVVFSPRGRAHALVPDPVAEVVCARFDFGQVFDNPLVLIDPGVVVIPMSRAPEIAATHALLMEEGLSQRCARGFAVERLMQYVLLVVFRHLIRTEALSIGLTRALADERLLKALSCIHKAPATRWTLESLAEVAGMSRTGFAQHFKALTGATPIGYLTRWRISVAQSLIAQGKPIKKVAAEVGYDSPAALTRVFSKLVGCGPRAWLERGADGTGADADAAPGLQGLPAASRRSEATAVLGRHAVAARELRVIPVNAQGPASDPP
jgi:AraC-like DNA-binding protein